MVIQLIWGIGCVPEVCTWESCEWKIFFFFFPPALNTFHH